jgi:tRNA (cmo5U34)-methyltransferase
MNMTTRKDKLFAGPKAPVDFVFDESVAAVFEDMINRSVPGYSTIISMIAVLAEKYCQPGSSIYDLGCSLGAATLAIREQMSHDNYRIIAVDNSPAMIEQLKKRTAMGNKAGVALDIICADLLDLEISNASVVVLNFTLQFIPLAKRAALLKRICMGMNPGGILILSEKIVFPDPALNELFIAMYHRFKEKRGYTKLEISRKRAALENVLLPESIATHKQRALDAGFTNTDVWFQCFNFASLVASK